MSSVSRESDTVDAQVIAAVDAGEPTRAVELAVQRFGPELLGYCVAVLRSEDAGGEVYSDLCMSLLAALPRFRGNSALRTFLYAIAWNLVRKYRRRTGRRRRLIHLEATQREVIDQAIRTSTAFYRRTAAKEKLAEVRSSLSAADQTLLILRIDRGLSWQEVAEVMEVEGEGSVARLRKRYERVVAKLRRLMDDHSGA